MNRKNKIKKYILENENFSVDNNTLFLPSIGIIPFVATINKKYGVNILKYFNINMITRRDTNFPVDVMLNKDFKPLKVVAKGNGVTCKAKYEYDELGRISTFETTYNHRKQYGKYDNKYGYNFKYDEFDNIEFVEKLLNGDVSKKTLCGIGVSDRLKGIIKTSIILSENFI